MKYIISCLTYNYARFSGRARRKEFWMFQLFNIPFFLLINILLINIQSPLSEILYIFSILLTLVLFLPQISVTVRRLHDINKSGGWVFLSAPVYLREMLKIMNWPSTAIMTIAIIGSIILLVMMIMPGNEGENQYGPDPKELDIE